MGRRYWLAEIDKGRMHRKTIPWTVLAIIGLLLIEVSIFAADVSCKYCGMRKAMCGHSWLIIYNDGGSMGEFCSLHCASIDMALNTD